MQNHWYIVAKKHNESSEEHDDMGWDIGKSDDKKEPAKSKWIQVDSSFIEAVAYTESLEYFEVKLKKGGSKYLFQNVPKEVFDDFMKAPSKGVAFNKIKKKYGPK